MERTDNYDGIEFLRNALAYLDSRVEERNNNKSARELLAEARQMHAEYGVPEYTDPEDQDKRRVVVSIRGGMVSAVFGDDKAVEVLIVDHDGYDCLESEVQSAAIVPLAEMSGDTLDRVQLHDDEVGI